MRFWLARGFILAGAAMGSYGGLASTIAWQEFWLRCCVGYPALSNTVLVEWLAPWIAMAVFGVLLCVAGMGSLDRRYRKRYAALGLLVAAAVWIAFFAYVNMIAYYGPPPQPGTTTTTTTTV